MLLRNGTVLSSSGGAPDPWDNQKSEVYYPPYLFTSTHGEAATAPRPQILSLTTNQMNYGQTVRFEMTSQSRLSQAGAEGKGAGISLVSKNANLCLDVSGASMLSGSGTIQTACSGSADQTFIGRRRVGEVSEQVAPLRQAACSPRCEPRRPFFTRHPWRISLKKRFWQARRLPQ